MDKKIKKLVLNGMVSLLITVLFIGCTDKKIDDLGTIDSSKPGIREVLPRTALPGNHIIISGVNFGDDRSAIRVMFDDQAAEIVNYSTDRIEVVVPAQTEAGYAKIHLEIGEEQSNQYYFTFGFTQPSIDSLTRAYIGDPVDIMGSGFGNLEENTTVTFGGEEVELLSVTDTLIRVVSPPLGDSITMDVRVDIGSKQSNVQRFSYLENLYSNPVVSQSLPDPTLIKAEDGFFYLYATEDIRNTPIMRSSDLVNWELVGTAFTDATRPTFEPNGGLWAPDVRYINGRYVLYYSMSVWGGEWTCGIGV